MRRRDCGGNDSPAREKSACIFARRQFFDKDEKAFNECQEIFLFRNGERIAMNGIGLLMRIAQAAALDARAKDKRCGLPDRLIALQAEWNSQ